MTFKETHGSILHKSQMRIKQENDKCILKNTSWFGRIMNAIVTTHVFQRLDSNVVLTQTVWWGPAALPGSCQPHSDSEIYVHPASSAILDHFVPPLYNPIAWASHTSFTQLFIYHRLCLVKWPHKVQRRLEDVCEHIRTGDVLEAIFLLKYWLFK